MKWTEQNYPCYVIYLTLILKKTFGPVWTFFGIATALAATVADAIWGDNAPVQYIAWAILAFVLVILLIRLLLLAPYQLWLEERSKIKALERPDGLKAKRSWLSGASASLLTSSKKIFYEWSASNERERSILVRDYREKRYRVSSLADNFLHEEDIFQAAQDVINQCDIVQTEVTEGLPNLNALQDAHRSTKNLLALLESNNGK